MMSVVLNLVALWLGILFCSPKPVTAIPAFNSTPQSPSYAVEGQNITLEWTFMLDGTLGLIQFFNVTDSIGSSFGPGTIAVRQKYQARFSGQANNTRAEMTIFEVKRSDESSYRVNVISSSIKAIAHDVKVVVLYQASITSISVHQTAKVGDLVWLNCTAVGLPEPSITWTILSTKRNVNMPLNITRKQDEGFYRCIANNGIGNPATADVFITVHYPVEATSNGKNATVTEGGVKSFSCPVRGNPEPVYESSTTVRSTTVEEGQEIRAILTILTNYEQAFKDLNSVSSKEFVAKFVEEMNKVYTNMPEYIRTEVTQLSAYRPGSIIVYFILYFKTAVTPKKGIENLKIAISSNGTFGDFRAKDLVLSPEEGTKSTTTSDFKCNCSDNETTFLVTIGVLVIVVIVLIVIIIWQHTKLRAIGKKRPYEEKRDTKKITMRDVDPTHRRSKNSTQQQIPDELISMPLQGVSPTGQRPITLESPAPNVEYAPLDTRTRSWEVARNDVIIERIIGNGAFGQVAKGMIKNPYFRSGATSLAIKMVKANARESDKRDLKSELELMKTLKPHPHVIKLLGCVTESEPLLVLIEYVPYGDLLGYLRKSRGLNDTYYKDPDIKPKSNLTSQQLMKFAWQIADGMSYLSLRKVIHRDLAARNVLVGERETCKITDFGMARDVQGENIYERKTKGRLPVKWTAYESLLYGQYTTKSDVWSYGVVLYEISTIGGSPYPKMEGRKIASLLQQGYRMPKPEHVDNDLYQIMMNCWQSEPGARPSFKDLTQWLKRMENQHKSLIKMHIYDNTLYANLEDLNA